MDIIPLSQSYSSIFSIQLEGETYNLRTLYNSRFGNWSFDIAKGTEEIANGVSMILGTDLIGQFNLNIGVLFMVDLDRTNIDATAFDIGTRVILVHTTEEEIQNALTV